mmetsp:Transcript_45387/g.109935  ORF Transcript_45387/g.109935 Transcript_45387/m.109935 type:complete len:521 (+) Transcript_45387:1339-2901(+)
MIRGPNRRKLSTLRYIIGDAVVTGRVNLEKSCLPENESELCFRPIVTLQLFLNGDVSIDTLTRLIVGLIENEKFGGVSVANTNRLLQKESQADVYIPLVDRWSLPGTFESVFYILIEELTSGSAPNPAPTLQSPLPSEVPSSNPSSFGGGGGGGSPGTPTRAPMTGGIIKAPTVSPTPRPTNRPTLAPAPGVTQEPTPEPSSKPTTVPSTTPSQNPTPTPLPTLAPAPGVTPPPTPPPTKEPTSAPTKQPTPSPTPAPVPGATPSPTRAPTPGTPDPTLATASPTPAPTSGPTSTPTLAPTPAPTSAPTSPPTPAPTPVPTPDPTSSPTSGPTSGPTLAPTLPVVTPRPTIAESAEPTARPVTILNFDDLTGASGECLGAPNEITDGYKGFQWDYFGVSDITCATGGADHSSPNGAGPISMSGNGFGESMSFELAGGGTFDLISVEAFNSGPSPCPFTLYGYGEGESSPAHDLDVTPASSDMFTIDLSSFTGVNKFEFFTSCTGPLTIIFDDFKMYMNEN